MVIVECVVDEAASAAKGDGGRGREQKTDDWAFERSLERLVAATEGRREGAKWESRDRAALLAVTYNLHLLAPIDIDSHFVSTFDPRAGAVIKRKSCPALFYEAFKDKTIATWVPVPSSSTPAITVRPRSGGPPPPSPSSLDRSRPFSPDSVPQSRVVSPYLRCRFPKTAIRRALNRFGLLSSTTRSWLATPVSISQRVALTGYPSSSALKREDPTMLTLTTGDGEEKQRINDWIYILQYRARTKKLIGAYVW